jgi:hypothetical protein
MADLSSSPQSKSFQKSRYLERKIAQGKDVSDPNIDAMINLFDSMEDQKLKRELDHKWRENNLEYDLRSTDWILEKTRNSNSYAQNLYAALCNNDFQKLDLWPILKEEKWHCSWRYAGGIIADMREQGDYMDWYCSGMGGLSGDYDSEGGESFEQWQSRTNYVPESTVTDEIREDLKALGWAALDI